MKVDMRTFAIGQLAKACGVNIDTVRYYERKALLLPVERTHSGYRRYSQDSINRLRFIRKTQSLGFSLKEIRGLLELSQQEEADCGDIREYARQKITEIEPRIADLIRIKDGLELLTSYCPGKGKPLSECSILEFFYADEQK